MVLRIASGQGPSGSRLRLEANDSGAAAIEFAILSPVFLLMLFGMIAYAIYFGAAHSVQQIAADASPPRLPGSTPPNAIFWSAATSTLTPPATG